MVFEKILRKLGKPTWISKCSWHQMLCCYFQPHYCREYDSLKFTNVKWVFLVLPHNRAIKLFWTFYYIPIVLVNFGIKACLLGRCLGQVGSFSIPGFSSVHMWLPFLCLLCTYPVKHVYALVHVVFLLYSFRKYLGVWEEGNWQVALYSCWRTKGLGASLSDQNLDQQ